MLKTPSFIVSLLLHGALGVWLWTSAPSIPEMAASKKTKNNDPIIVTLLPPAPPVAAPITPPVTPEKIPPIKPAKPIKPVKKVQKRPKKQPPKKQPAVRKKHTQQKAAKTRTTRQQPSPAKKHTATNNATPSTTKTSTAKKAQYQSILVQHINAYKKYPRRAKQVRMQGTGTAIFSITPHGALQHARITKSTGHHILDDEILATLKRATPFPKPPPNISLEFKAPLRFSLQ